MQLVKNSNFFSSHVSFQPRQTDFSALTNLTFLQLKSMMNRSDDQKSKKKIKFHHEPKIIKFSQDEPAFALGHENQRYIRNSNFPFMMECQSEDELINILEEKSVLLKKFNFRGSYFVGYVAVKNISYNKEVYVRYSFDDWKTIRENQAHFFNKPVQLKSGVFTFVQEPFDTFVFEIDLEGHFNRDTKLKFAIRYKTGNHVYWDNNNQQDYIIEFRVPHPSNAPSSKSIIPKPILRFNLKNQAQEQTISQLTSTQKPEETLEEIEEEANKNLKFLAERRSDTSGKEISKKRDK